MAKLKSTQKPFFSLIIPTLNEEKYLPLLLLSLKNQTFKNFEVLLVDAQSEDKTVKKAQSFSKKLPGLKISISKKRGICFQRNLGAKTAKGQYLIFIDADVSLDQEVLKKAYDYIADKKPDLFLTKINLIPKKLTYRLMAFTGNLIFLAAVKFGKNIGTGAFIGIKKKVFNSIKGFDEQLALSEEHHLIKKARKNNYHLDLIKNIKIDISSRRIEKEGIIKFLLKYLYFIVYEHLKGPIYKPPLKYPMGGSYYD